MKSSIATLLSCMLVLSAFASGKRISRSEYIDTWKDEAIYQMVVHHIPASITLAQGILESGDGNSMLAKDANNHFGIKCHSDWNGESIRMDDDARNECFRKYNNAGESFNDHSEFLKRKRYASLFELEMTDYKGWAKGLKKCGYATNPKYAHRLIEIIEANHLTAFDEQGLSIIESGSIPDYLADAGKEEKKTRKTKEPRTRKLETDDELPGVNVVFAREVNTSPNQVPYIVAKDGDTYNTICEDLEMRPWQIKKYNDLKGGEVLESGQVIYIKPKRTRAKEEFHIMQEGETLWSVSQEYGIKLSALYKKNNLLPGTEPAAGTKISLRNRVKMS
ncbi:MAG: glucosaminidase domain-containing protein [Flavobacteriales bacterium]|nr:glucosaminidase domain-containing protein [Flavobacteriales bacterium]